MIFHIDEAERGGAVALIEARRRWSYRDLARAVTAYQAALSPTKRVGFVFCRSRVDSILWYLAALEEGHPVALLDDSLAEEFRANLIAIYQPDWIASSQCPGAGYRFQNNLWLRTTPCEEPFDSRLALLLSTSGTTGSPKFVRLTRGNIEANAESIAQALRIGPEDRAIGSLPLHYSYGLSVLNTHLLRGGSFVLTEDTLLSRGFWDTARRERCTSFAGVPHSYHMLRRLDLEALDVGSLRTLTQAGGKLDAGNIEHFHRIMKDRGGRFFVMYGQTEATARICVLEPEALPEKAASVGRAIPGGAVSIVEGELVYEGPNVMMGYATSRADLNQGDELCGRLRTGDAAYFDEEGYVHIVGRAGREAKIFGLRLNLDEVEALLKPYGPTAVTASADRLLIFCEHGDEAAYGRYQRELAERLRLHHRTFSFRSIEKLPVNSSGKIDYRRLPV